MADLNWSTEANTCANVGRLSSGQNGTLNEIESGNPAASYVIWKVEGSGPNNEPISGVQMPMSMPPLTAMFGAAPTLREATGVAPTAKLLPQASI